MDRIPDGVAGERPFLRLPGESQTVRLPGESRGPGTPCLDSGLRVRVRNDASTLWRLLSACLLASTLLVYGPASAAEPARKALREVPPQGSTSIVCSMLIPRKRLRRAVAARTAAMMMTM